jgi:aryl-alcohol dehydrogenase-like predicted oxidoreductase
MHDATTPIDQAVRALDDQLRLGKVLDVGISDSPAWVAAQAATLAALRGWSPFAGLQIP